MLAFFLCPRIAGRSSVESYRSFTFSDEDFVDLVVDFVKDLFHR